MNRIWMVSAGVIALIGGVWAATTVAVAQDADATKADGIMNDASYAIGYTLGEEIRRGLETDDVNADLDRIIQGFERGLRSLDAAVDQEAMDAALIALQKRVAQRHAAQRLQSDPVFKAQADENARRGAIFRERFAEKEGVRELGDGIYYMVVKEADGPTPGMDDRVVLDYQGLLINGEEFQRGRLAEVDVVDTLPGAQKVLSSMSVGERWYVVIPPEHAYGAAGRVPDIGPNETLVFDVTLVNIK